MSKITKSANGQMCIRCNTNDGTTCARHYNGIYQHQFGKGRGKKCHDLASAELCSRCDAMFTEGVNAIDDERASKSIGRSDEFQRLIILTNISRYDRGDL